MMHEKVIGIIGGTGPYAGLDLIKKIFDNTRAKSDYEHLPVILYSVPQLVPNRTDFITGKSPVNPSTGIIKGIQNLIKAGANLVAIACNAAHSAPIFNPVKEWVEQKSQIDLISMVESAVEFVLSINPQIRKVGILAVYGTYKSQVYDNAFTQKGIDIIKINEKMQHYVHNIIWDPSYGIKANSNPVTNKARKELLNVITYMVNQGADAIISACTEIPLALPEKRIKNTMIIDTNETLARKLIKLCNPEKLKTVIY